MRVCIECDIAPAKKGEVMCVGCLAAITDDRPDRPGESHYDLKEKGDWVFDPVRRIQVWEPAPPEEPVEEPAPVIEWIPGDLPDGVYESDLRTCEHTQCRRRFIPTTGKQIYCGVSCKDAAYYLRRKARERVAA